MARSTILPALLAGVFCLVLLGGVVLPEGREQEVFVHPQLRSTAAVLAEKQAGKDGLAQLAAATPALAVVTLPEIASAATQQELNRFGFVFAVIFLLFFLAAFGRLLTVGKL
eukprot:CAMPEP_0113826134 /NCGR_PEP_ID=MMETSP0328-20130328/4107_1 /TAXON_ID=39455 /ORGANISM="Alexandrium minutum" /LENGTH=111 /DNA_ID=CAMNT_0000794107 /DNA_START=89 /DNA_END=424 /DNA_ORIENTATION=- /assembly_acc=CAM_ASM_000350